MPTHQFDNTRCRPAMLDPKTQQSLPDDDPTMIIVNRIWDEQTSLAIKEAWHRVCCCNSRDASDLELASAFSRRINEALVIDRRLSRKAACNHTEWKWPMAECPTCGAVAMM